MARFAPCLTAPSPLHLSPCSPLVVELMEPAHMHRVHSHGWPPLLLLQTSCCFNLHLRRSNRNAPCPQSWLAHAAQRCTPGGRKQRTAWRRWHRMRWGRPAGYDRTGRDGMRAQGRGWLRALHLALVGQCLALAPWCSFLHPHTSTPHCTNTQCTHARMHTHARTRKHARPPTSHPTHLRPLLLRQLAVVRGRGPHVCARAAQRRVRAPLQRAAAAAAAPAAAAAAVSDARRWPHAPEWCASADS